MTIINLTREYTLDVIKAIPMGGTDDSDLIAFVNAKYLKINSNNQVYIKRVTGLNLRLTSNGCLEIVFDDGVSAYDLMFDSDEEEKEYVKINTHIIASFEYEGMEITDPYMDESGRFEVDPKKYYGLKENELKVFNK